ncbi:hypothetical protein IWQ60_000551 [Tieghemiomyces parasiticus]|uniref:Major facilitator superfamily (MFS) profile domain-containing protein n=1 Tax=Tieghemiomyces parasiticus TaxID=78921 RepID=A0A9W8DXG1_9FUNG|nr:hypothetical protein IWQ60_000551 [Tieghemiomyces parasiticus]
MHKSSNATLGAHSLEAPIDYDLSGSETLYAPPSTDAAPRSILDIIYRKIDLRILPLLVVANLFYYLDGIGIGNAKLLNIQESLGLSQMEYSWTLSLLYAGYLIFSMPSNIMLKLTSPSLWLGFVVILGGTLCSCMAAVQSPAALLVLRFLLGGTQSGFQAGVVYYFTLWYHQSELPVRFSIFYAATMVAGAVSGLLAFAIGRMDGLANLASWRWLFLLEGLPLVILGLCFLFLPNDPESSRWLDARDKAALVQHHGRPESGEKHTARSISRADIHAALTSPFTYLHSLILFCIVVPLGSISFLMSTVIHDLGFDDIQAQLFTVPPFLVAAVVMLVSCRLLSRTGEHGLHIALSAGIGALGFLLLAFLDSQAGKYAALFLAAIGSYSIIPVNLGWLTSNILNSSQRAVASAFVTALGNVSGVLAGQMYRKAEATRYLTSHVCNAGALLVILMVALTFRVFQQRQGRQVGVAGYKK